MNISTNTVRKTLIISSAAAYMTSGAILGYALCSWRVDRKMKTVSKLLTNAIVEAVDNSFDKGMTKTEVMDALESDLIFIAQVM